MSSVKKQPAEACHRPAGLEYFADRNAARVLIPRQVGAGHDAIELRKVPEANGKRLWVVRLNNFPSFSISTRQLMSVRQFRKVAFRRLLDNGRDFEQWPRDVLVLPQASWFQIAVRLVNCLWRGGAE
jgi:hypothetical protein